LSVVEVVETVVPTHAGRRTIYTGDILCNTMSETQTQTETEQGTVSEESILENERLRYGGILVLGLILGILVGMAFGGGALTGTHLPPPYSIA